MSDWSPPSQDAIQQEAYFLWEADGRPPGLDQEYWMRARAVLHERARLLAEAEAAASAARQTTLDLLAALPWPCEPAEKPVKRLSYRGAKRLPAFRGPATRPVRAER